MNSFQNLDTAKAIQLWMSGTYSFTILEIAKIENDIIMRSECKLPTFRTELN